MLASSVLHFVPEWKKLGEQYPVDLVLYSGSEQDNPELPDEYPEFKVIPTECKSFSKLHDKNCRHSCMVNDRYIVQTVVNATTNLGRGYGPAEHREPLSDAEVAEMQSQCRAIRD